MTIDMARYRRRRQEAKSRGGAFWRPQDKKRNAIRLFAFKHEVAEADFKLGRYNPKLDRVEAGQEVEELDCPIMVHFVGSGPPVLCGKMVVGAQCDLCEEAADIADEQEGRRRKARHQYVIQIVPTDQGVEQKVQQWSAPSSAYTAMLGYVTDEEYAGLFGCKGRDFIVDFDSDRDPSEMYAIRLRDKDKCEELPATLQKQVKDLMAMPEFMPPEMHGAGTAKGGGDEPSEPEPEPEEKPKASAARSKRQEAEGLKDDDEKPSKRSKDADAEAERKLRDWSKADGVKVRFDTGDEGEVQEGIVQGYDEKAETLAVAVKEKKGTFVWDVPVDQVLEVLEEPEEKPKSGRRSATRR